MATNKTYVIACHERKRLAFETLMKCPICTVKKFNVTRNTKMAYLIFSKRFQTSVFAYLFSSFKEVIGAKNWMLILLHKYCRYGIIKNANQPEHKYLKLLKIYHNEKYNSKKWYLTNVSSNM